MPPYVCALYRSEDQTIPPNTLTLVRFPFDVEAHDDLGMHDHDNQGDGGYCAPPPTGNNWKRAGMIWPSHDGWGVLTAMVQLENDSTYSYVHTRFVRDPENFTTGFNSTGHLTIPRANDSPKQFITNTWQIETKIGTPLALLVEHDGSMDATLSFAQLKLAIL